MVESATTIPVFTVSADVDMSQIVALAAEARERGEDAPSFNDFVVKAAAATLREFPRFNASYVDGKVELLLARQRRHRGRDRRRTARAGRARRRPRSRWPRSPRRRDALADAARRRTLRPEDFHDGTFTVSNLGMFGVRSFTAIIDPPQVAILAVGGARRAPVEEVPIASPSAICMTVTLSCDHRVVYGADGARFLSRLRELLERPLASPSDADERHVAFRTAIRDALDEELAADERVILFGEDVAVAGGVFATTTGLYDKYGPERVFDTPISELALAGAAFGSAVHGLRPVIEIMFGDFLTLAMDSLVNQSTKYWFLTQEQVSVPLDDPLGRRRRRPLRRDPLADAGVVVHGRPGPQDRRRRRTRQTRRRC